MATINNEPIACVTVSIGELSIFDLTMKIFSEMESKSDIGECENSIEYIKLLIQYTCFFKSETEDDQWIELTEDQLNALTMDDLCKIAYEILKFEVPGYSKEKEPNIECCNDVINDLYERKRREREALISASKSFGGLQGLSSQIVAAYQQSAEQFSMVSKFTEPYLSSQIEQINRLRKLQQIVYPNIPKSILDSMKIAQASIEPVYEQINKVLNTKAMRDFVKTQNQHADYRDNILAITPSAYNIQPIRLPTSVSDNIILAESSTHQVNEVIKSGIKSVVDNVNDGFKGMSKSTTRFAIISILLTLLFSFLSLYYGCKSSRKLESQLERLIEINATK